MVSEMLLHSISKPAIESLIKDLIAPKIKEVTKICAREYEKLMIPREKHLEEYLLRAYEKYSTINTLVFRNSQRLLKDIYIPQTLVLENQFSRKNEIVEIDKFPIELIKKYKKILITDTAGMGKSTIMRRMFIDVVDNCMKEIGIPIYIELNRLKKSNSILDEIKKELSSLSEEFSNDLLLRLIQTGGFVFFLDGYDEISIVDRNEVTSDIQTFISKAGIDNYYILTSRPDSSLSSFGDFQSFNIQSLKKEEAFELLKKYDLTDNAELSSKLIKLLESGQYDVVDEYLINPLLVSLLFTAYDYNRSIPFEKHRFYGVVFEAYFEKHDFSKPMKSRDKFSGLNYDGFDRVLRYLGYDCLMKTGVKFSEDTILNSIREAKEFCGNLEFSESLFLKDLISSVPLFCKDGTDYKWVHKSLLEYFAARFIFCDAKQNQDKILTGIYKSENVEKYINLLDLYYSIDFNGFNKNIRYPFCKEYVSYYDSINFESITIPAELIDERKSKLFVCRPIMMKLGCSTLSVVETTFGEKFQDSDLFKKYFEKYNEINDIFKYTAFTLIYGDNILVVRCSSPLLEILNLLYRHSKELFTTSKYNFKRDKTFFEENFENDKDYKIDIEIGDSNSDLYAMINRRMFHLRTLKTDISFNDYLDYAACKKVVDNYEKSLNIDNDIFNLF